jgi:iron complex outermembrane receptor protein
MRRTQFSVGVALWLEVCAATYAQTEIQAPEVTVEGIDESAYGGYNVEKSASGTKTDTPILEIPQSVQVVPRQVIEEQNALTIFDVLRNVSNVQSQDADNSDETFVIRGFDVETAPARDGAGFKVTGVVGAPDLAGVERVEVLKGPASVLYGTGDAGGLINLVSKRPLRLPNSELTSTLGSFGFYRGEADLSGPLTDDRSLRYRFNAAYEHSDSFRDYFVNPESTYLAPAIAIGSGSATELTIFAEYQKEDTQLDPGIPLLPNRQIPNVPFRRYYGEPFATFDVPVYTLRYVFDHKLSDDWAFRSTGAFQNADSEAGAIEFDEFEDERSVGREFERQREEQRRYSLQNEMIGKIGTDVAAHTVLAGIEFSSDQTSGEEDIFELAPIDIFDPVAARTVGPFVERFTFDEDLDTFGVYLQDQIKFSDRWTVVAGARYDRYTRKDRTSDGIDARDEDHRISPRVGLVYQPLPALSWYASYSRSFRPQVGLQQFGGSVDAEIGRQVEAGVKAEFFNQRARATLALFEIVKENVLVSDPDESTFSIQTGEQRSRGIELDIGGEVAAGWNVIAALGWVNAEVTRDVLIREGTDLANAPGFSGRLWSTYNFFEGLFDGLALGGGVTYVGKRNGDLFQPYDIPSYTRYDAFLSYRISDNLDLSLNLENLFDENYVNSADTSAVHPGPPFSVFARVELRL